MSSALDLATSLVRIAETLVENRRTQIADETLRRLRDEVAKGRAHLSEDDFAIGYEAACLIECIAELAYARSDADQRREERALMYLNSFRTFVQMDVDRAAHKAVTP